MAAGAEYVYQALEERGSDGGPPFMNTDGQAGHLQRALTGNELAGARPAVRSHDDNWAYRDRDGR